MHGSVGTEHDVMVGDGVCYFVFASGLRVRNKYEYVKFLLHTRLVFHGKL